MDDLIRAGLTSSPKWLPAALLYDDLGSALFEAITFLPEYEVSRAGIRLLKAHADAVVAGAAGGDAELELVELGPGAGRKAQILVEALQRRQREVHFVGVDVSPQALADCRRTLERFPGVAFEGITGLYLEGLAAARASHRTGTRRLVLFLGSNLSNFARADAQEFLHGLRAQVDVGDRLLLGVDLDKDPARLLPAYDDALGVTAAFDKNLLVRLNRDWGADFPLANFDHEARYDAAERRIEMHLRARRACHVTIGKLDLCVAFAAGESIWTESSHRFAVDELRAWGAAAGFRVAAQWLDGAWPFAQTLYEVV